MRLMEAGRFLFPHQSERARAYVQTNLLSIHGRTARLQAIAGRAHLQLRQTDLPPPESLRQLEDLGLAPGSDWLLLRDYDGNQRERVLLFLFAEAAVPQYVVKIRSEHSSGESLRREADVLRHVRAVMDERTRRVVPEVIEMVITGGRELLVTSSLAGKSLSLLMQRSLRPRHRHARHLAGAGDWLGRLHAATRDGGRAVVHGDFWPRNLLFTDDRSLAGVVDWEHGSVSGDYWPDVFSLPLLFVIAAPSWRTPDALTRFQKSFAGRGGLSPAVGAYFRAYSTAAGSQFSDLRARFEDYLLNRSAPAGKEDGWGSQFPWPAMLAAMREARRSVFSG